MMDHLSLPLLAMLYVVRYCPNKYIRSSDNASASFLLYNPLLFRPIYLAGQYLDGICDYDQLLQCDYPRRDIYRLA